MALEISRTCPTCGKSITNDKLFCNRDCFNNRPSHLHTMTCEQCGNQFIKTSSQMARSKHHFCSRQCSHAWHRTCVSVACEQCSKIVKRKPAKLKTTQHTFCSPECRYVWLSENTKGEKCPTWKGGLIKVSCAQCGKDILREPNQLRKANRYFCSRTCYGLWVSTCTGSKAPNWQGGLSFEPYTDEFNDDLKQWVRSRDGYECQLCHMSEQEHIQTQGRVLSVHHIDYCKTNNNPNSNLIALCIECHGKTNGNRAYYEQLLTSILEGIASLPIWEQPCLF